MDIRHASIGSDMNAFQEQFQKTHSLSKTFEPQEYAFFLGTSYVVYVVRSFCAMYADQDFCPILFEITDKGPSVMDESALDSICRLYFHDVTNGRMGMAAGINELLDKVIYHGYLGYEYDETTRACLKKRVVNCVCELHKRGIHSLNISDTEAFRICQRHTGSSKDGI